MLPPETQHRIYAEIPRELTLDWRKPVHGTDPDPTYTETITLTVKERQQDVPNRNSLAGRDDYPVAIVWFDPTSVKWGGGQRLPETHYKEDVPGDDTVAYREYVGEDMYDQLNVLIAVQDNHGNIPKSVVGKKLAQEVYAQYLLNTDHLNDPATIPADEDYIWPVKIVETTGEGITPLPPASEDTPVLQYAMQFNCHYTFTKSEEVPSVDAIEYTTEIEDAEGTIATDSGRVDFNTDGS